MEMLLELPLDDDDEVTDEVAAPAVAATIAEEDIGG